MSTNKYIARLLFVALTLMFSSAAVAQNYSISQLFYPNINLSYRNTLGVNKETSQNQDYTRSGAMAFIPLRTELQAGIGFRKKLDIRAIHTVAAVNYANHQSAYNTLDTYKTVGVHVLQLNASLRDKVWLYGGGVGYTEASKSFFTPSPLLWGGAARLRVFTPNSMIIYGSAIMFNQKLQLIPIIGANQKLGKHWRISGILPFQASVSYKLNNWCNAEWHTALRGYTAGYKEGLTNSPVVNLREHYQQINSGLSVNFHVAKAINLSLEGGYAFDPKVKTLDASGNTIEKTSAENSPFVGVSLRYITSKSKLSSKFMNRIGL
jgi:hypothetical protein